MYKHLKYSLIHITRNLFRFFTAFTSRYFHLLKYSEDRALEIPHKLDQIAGFHKSKHFQGLAEMATDPESYCEQIRVMASYIDELCYLSGDTNNDFRNGRDQRYHINYKL